MMNAKTITTMLGLLLVTLLASGCQMVHVMDQDGDPVFWAKVQVAPTASERGENLSMPYHTDFLGNVMLPKGMSETTEYLIVSKEGYQTKTAARGVDNKIEIQLQKQPTANTPASGN
jgi:hypothetical protein